MANQNLWLWTPAVVCSLTIFAHDMYPGMYTLLYTCAFQLLQMNSLTHIRSIKNILRIIFYRVLLVLGVPCSLSGRTTFYFVLLLSLINLHHIEFFVQPRFWENQPPPRRLPFFVGIKQHRLTKAFKTCATKTNVYLRSCKGSNLPPLESFLGSYSICEFCD